MLKLTSFLLLFITFQSQAIEIVNKDFSNKNITNIHQGTNEIILTFDDGPTVGVTDKILDILKMHNLKATFFVVGANAARNPALMQRMADEGHIVGNHTMNHKNLKKMGYFFIEDQVREEILKAHAIITPYAINNRHNYFRAPEGAWGGQAYADFLNVDDLGKAYIGPVFWDIGGEIELKDGQYRQAADWACWSKKPVALTVDECMSGYLNEIERRKGGVILMHDIRLKSVEMLEKLIPELMMRGYGFSTLNDVNWN